MPNAVITGASRGLGLALARVLGERGWNLVIDARHREDLERAATEMANHTHVVALPGDVSDTHHRAELASVVRKWGSLDLLVNNASVLGPSPQPTLHGYPLDILEWVFKVNTLAPLALAQELLPELRAASGTIVNVTSDAAVEPYEGWGGYGSSKAALDQITAILGAEEPDVSVYAFDPGDMRTVMHQHAFPGEDISDRPEPETVVPSFLRLIDDRPPSGRYRSTDLDAQTAQVPA
ncbi:MAG: hypothetical protein QOF16_13 [Actinomycetota bacterium]|nr:hypothetical protein [Actinomycetota bacterium]